MVQQAQDCLNELKTWFTSLKLTLNARKTETILFGTSRALRHCQFSGLIIDGCTVLPSKKVRSLGVILDQELNLESHESKIRANAFNHLRLIARSRRCTSRATCPLLVHAFVLSHLNFCPIILNGISSSLTSRLQAIVNSAMRLVYGKKKSESISAQMKKHEWLPVPKLIEIRTLLFLHLSLASEEPRYLFKQLHWYAPRRELRSQSSHLLAIPRTKTKIGERAFTIFAPKLWNKLPLSLRQETSFTKLERSLTNLFLVSQ